MEVEYILVGKLGTGQWHPARGSFDTVPGGWLNPRYGLETRTTVHDSPAAAPSLVTDTASQRPETGVATSVTVDPGPGRLNLTTATAYEEPGAGRFFRRTSRTLPAGNASTYAHYTPTDGADNPCTPEPDSVHQGGLPRTTTSPDPDGPGPQVARVTEVVYDAAGRPVTSRVGTEPWTCAAYDGRGRIKTRTISAFGGQPARTVSSN